MQYAKVERLVTEGIIESGDALTEKQKQQIENLSDQEIDALRSIKKKLDAFEWPISTVVKARMF